MKVTAEQIAKNRYGNSTVYELHILVDGEKVTHRPNPDEPESVRVFAIQVQDGLDVREALTGFLENFKKTFETPPADDLPLDLEV